MSPPSLNNNAFHPTFRVFSPVACKNRPIGFKLCAMILETDAFNLTSVATFFPKKTQHLC